MHVILSSILLSVSPGYLYVGRCDGLRLFKLNCSCNYHKQIEGWGGAGSQHLLHWPYPPPLPCMVITEIRKSASPTQKYIPPPDLPHLARPSVNTPLTGGNSGKYFRLQNILESFHHVRIMFRLAVRCFALKSFSFNRSRENKKYFLMLKLLIWKRDKTKNLLLELLTVLHQRWECEESFRSI